MSTSLTNGSLVLDLKQLRIETYLDVAASALLVYDYLLTLSAEVSLIWPSPRSYMKVLFFLARYMVFFDIIFLLQYDLRHVSSKTCDWMYSIGSVFLVVGIIVSEIIMAVRTWAIWERNKWVGISLAGLLCAAIISAPVILAIFLKSISPLSSPNLQSPGCLWSAGNPIIAVDFILLMLIETVLVILTLIKGVQHYRREVNNPFIFVLYRDGILFYVYLFVFSAVNLIVIVTAPGNLANILTVLQRVLHSCLSTRVLTHIRAAHEKALGSESEFVPVSDVVFGRGQGVPDSSLSADTSREVGASSTLLERA